MFVRTGWFHSVGRGLAPAVGRGLRLRRNAPDNTPGTARRHTQVPPYIHRRTADMGRRAGPMCPAAGMHRKQYDRVIGSDRVGRGLAPAAGTHSPGCGGGPSHIPHGGTRRCRPTNTNGMPICSAAGTGLPRCDGGASGMPRPTSGLRVPPNHSTHKQFWPRIPMESGAIEHVIRLLILFAHGIAALAVALDGI